MRVSTANLVARYKKYGPLLYSHFYRLLGQERLAVKATRYAFIELLALGLRDDAAIVRWVRGLSLPVEAAQSDSLW
jgi:hypothetical protein